MAFLEIKDLSFTYPTASAPTLEHISLTVEKGSFTVLCGKTGCGKSTLLRRCKPELALRGTCTGEVLLDGVPLSELSARASAASVGYVMQKPEQQIVTDTVSHELAFGLENLGCPQAVIARRIAEICCFFGMQSRFDQPTASLSGGQKQMLNLASVMVMDPELLLLDEPTAQLDPIAARELLSAVKRLNEELGVTVIIAEHRLEELIPMCGQLVLMDKGRIVAEGEPRELLSHLQLQPQWLSFMPAPVRLYHELKGSGECPLTLQEGRAWLRARGTPAKAEPTPGEPPVAKRPALELQGVSFRYARELPDVLRGTDLTVWEGEHLCLLGGNSSGKSTLLRVIAGLSRPWSGQLRIFGKRQRDYHGQSLYRACLALLPQDVQTVFLKDTVWEELQDAGAEPTQLPFSLSHLYATHPYDLSGGEQQLLALAKLLASKPRLLLLDEPTKGLDAEKKTALAELLHQLKQEGVTLITVTHDVEFAAFCADRCALFFAGQVLSAAPCEEFFSQNRFYTTAACRMSRGIMEGAVTVEQLAVLCRRHAKEKPC